jgi:hypothetical protein
MDLPAHTASRQHMHRHLPAHTCTRQHMRRHLHTRQALRQACARPSIIPAQLSPRLVVKAPLGHLCRCVHVSARVACLEDPQVVGHAGDEVRQVHGPGCGVRAKEGFRGGSLGFTGNPVLDCIQAQGGHACRPRADCCAYMGAWLHAPHTFDRVVHCLQALARDAAVVPQHLRATAAMMCGDWGLNRQPGMGRGGMGLWAQVEAGCGSRVRGTQPSRSSSSSLGKQPQGGHIASPSPAPPRTLQ